MITRIISIAENFCFFAVGVFFISIVLPFRSKRNSDALDDAIRSMQQEGAKMEEFIRQQYSFDIDGAIVELRRLGSQMVQFLIYLTSDLNKEP